MTYSIKKRLAQFTTNCPTCGETHRLTHLTMTQSLVDSLKLLNDYNQQYGLANTGDIPNMKRTQYSNINKLKYWGFIEIKNEGKQVTPEGRMFLKGGIKVRLHLLTFRDKLVQEDHIAWSAIPNKLVGINEYSKFKYSNNPF